MWYVRPGGGGADSNGAFLCAGVSLREKWQREEVFC